MAAAAAKSRRKSTARAGRGPCFVVASLDEAHAALRSLSGARATLVSPPGAAAYLGPAYWWAVVEAARAAYPQLAIDAVMDCGCESGSALSALRTGFKAVVLSADAPGRARVAAIARRLGARIVARPPAER